MVTPSVTIEGAVVVVATLVGSFVSLPEVVVMGETVVVVATNSAVVGSFGMVTSEAVVAVTAGTVVVRRL